MVAAAHNPTRRCTKLRHKAISLAVYGCGLPRKSDVAIAGLPASEKWFQGIINHARPPLIKLNACTGGLGDSTCVAFPSGRRREALLPLYDLILIKNAF